MKNDDNILGQTIVGALKSFTKNPNNNESQIELLIRNKLFLKEI